VGPDRDRGPAGQKRCGCHHITRRARGYCCDCRILHLYSVAYTPYVASIGSAVNHHFATTCGNALVVSHRGRAEICATVGGAGSTPRPLALSVERRRQGLKQKAVSSMKVCNLHPDTTHSQAGPVLAQGTESIRPPRSVRPDRAQPGSAGRRRVFQPSREDGLARPFATYPGPTQA